MSLFENGRINFGHPIFVLPASLAAMALVIAPFAIWSGAEAAQLFGALLGSTLSSAAAVIAVVLTSRLEGRRERERDDRLAAMRILAVCRIAREELRSIDTFLKLSRLGMPLSEDKKGVPVDPGTREFVALVGTFGRLDKTAEIIQSIRLLCEIPNLAQPLLSFRSTVLSTLESIDTIREFHRDGLPFDVNWGHFRTIIFLIDIYLPKSIAALDEFIDTHTVTS